MRRWLAIVLLALLPLQFSWAAVAAYCAHEAGGSHVGHHEHQHHGVATPDTAADGDDAQADTKLPGAADADCGHCHGGCAGVLAAVAIAHAASPRGRPVIAPEKSVRARAPTPPERPQWAALA